jgi:WD40 repeat protein
VNRDATRVLTWADDGETRVWDAADGKLLFTLDSIAVVAGAVWNSDETRILTWSSDGAARVWDAAHGTLLLTLRHQSEVNGAAWNTDGTRILTWSRDGTARVWLVDLDQLIILAKSYKLHPLNDDELASFFLPTLEPTATSTPLATIIPLPTITPEPAIPTATSVAAGSASAGDNRGEIAVGGGQIWTYQGQAGETVTFTVLADHPGSGNDPNEWVAKGLFDTLLGIYSPDGTPLVSNDDLDGTTLANGSVTDTNSQISDLTLPNDGAYLIEIRSAYGGKTGGEYTLVIESSRSAGPASTPTPTPTSAPTATPAP